ncbi:cbb3-type cytochrome c oxidase subunit I [Chloroflexi bacterium CFX6]|nr:cbb3-type cytochrome c oxidase subunit I [Chloroflexi bacterium CFX6]
MPLLTRIFVKTALVYFALALVFGILLALRAPNSLFPVYIHLFVFGWLTQLIFGVVYWMFPKYSTQLPRGRDALAWIAYGAMNAGLILRAVAEPMQASRANDVFGALLAVSAALQWLAGVAFIANTWGRVKEK